MPARQTAATVIIVLEDISFTILSETNSRRNAQHYLSPSAQIRQLRQTKQVRWLKHLTTLVLPMALIRISTRPPRRP
jgi:hypothetical protein